MLEVKYGIETRMLGGWCASKANFGGLKPNDRQAVAMLDVDIPQNPPDAYLVKADLSGLELNPDYKYGEPPRDLEAEIDELGAEIEKLK